MYILGAERRKGEHKSGGACQDQAQLGGDPHVSIIRKLGYVLEIDPRELIEG